MGWDSNPRDPCGSAGFQDRCLQPLGHPSGRQQVSRKRSQRNTCELPSAERYGSRFSATVQRELEPFIVNQECTMLERRRRGAPMLAFRRGCWAFCLFILFVPLDANASLASPAAQLPPGASAPPEVHCPQGIESIQNPQLAIEQTTDGLKFELAGTVVNAKSADPRQRLLEPGELCEVVFGNSTLNRLRICDLFGAFYDERNRYVSDGRTAHFSILGFQQSAPEHLSFRGEQPRLGCATNATILVRRNPKSPMAFIEPPPEQLTDKGVVFSLTRGGFFVRFSSSSPLLVHRTSAMASSIWNEWTADDKSKVQSAIGFLLGLTFLVIAFWLFSLRGNSIDNRELNLAQCLMRAATTLAVVGLLLYSRVLFTGSLLDWIDSKVSFTNAFLSLGLIVVAFGLLSVPRSKRTGLWTLSTIFGAIVFGLTLSVGGFLAFSEIFRRVPAASSIGYEVPAICVSLIVVLIVVLPAQRYLAGRRQLLWVAALLLGISFLYPFGPCVHFSYDLSESMNNALHNLIVRVFVQENTTVWLGFVAYELSAPLVAVAILVAGFAGSRLDGGYLGARRLLGLFLLSTIQYASLGLINLICVVAVWIAASHAVLEEDRDEVTVAETHRPQTIALWSGAVACVIFWLQYASRPANPADDFSLLITSGYLVTIFTSAALGMLLIAQSHQSIRGETAFIKAICVLSAAAVVAIASSFSSVIENHSVSAALVSLVPIAGAVMLVSVWVYDLPKIRHALAGIASGGESRAEFVKQMLPIVSAIVVALTTSLTTTFFSGLNKAQQERLAAPAAAVVSAPSKDHGKPDSQADRTPQN
jgi:hypothetical protein